MTDQSTLVASQATSHRFFWITAAGLAVVVMFAPWIPWQGSKLLHLSLDSIAVCVALFVGVTAWIQSRTRQDRLMQFIAVGFVGTSCLDGFHAIVSMPSIPRYVATPLPQLIDWSWFVSRLFLAIVLYLSWVDWRYKLLDRFPVFGRLWRHESRWFNFLLRSERRPSLIAALAMVVGVIVAAISVIVILPLPLMSFPDAWLRRPVEWIPGALFGLAMLGFVSKGAWRQEASERWLVGSLMVAFVSQMMMVAFSATPLDVFDFAAHVLKIVSYAFVLTGLMSDLATAMKRADEMSRMHARTVAQFDRSSEDLSVFMRSASHDLKAPLRHVTGFSDFVLQDAKDRLTPEESQDLQRISEAATRMTNLIDRLLQFTRLETESLDAANIDLTQVVDGVVVQLPRDQQARIVYEQLGEVRADHKLLTLVITNLIENGLKYADDNDSTVKVRSESLSDATQVSVSDEGIGIAVAQTERVFQPGARGVAESEFEGSGYGLAICERIVNAHGGRIWIEANPDKGSTIHFTLPNDESSVQILV